MWNKVELLINDDTNTVRLSLGDSALYQVDTLVKLSSSENVVSNPKLYASLTSTSCIVICDTSVVLFDPSFQTVLLHLYFDTSVDAVCSEGSFLLVGERNGNLHLIYVPLQKIVMTKALQQAPSNGEESTFKSLILQEISDCPGMFLLFLTVQEGVVIISGLDLGKAQKAIGNVDITTLNELQGLIRMDFCSTNDIHDGGCTSAVRADLDNRLQLLIGGKGGNSLSQWKIDQSQCSLFSTSALDSTLIPGVRKIQVMDTVMYVLNEEDMLSVWDVHSFVMLCCWPDFAIQDFLLSTEGDSASITSQESTNMKMITLGTADDKQMRRLMVQSLPSMDIVYSMEVSGVASLVQSGMNMDTIYLLEGIAENPKSPDSGISAIVLRCFTEALPENRFNRLLYKHKFEEAEQFALTFGLDVELVYKVKLDAIGGKLACHLYGQQDLTRWSDLIEEAKTNLMKITDEPYVVQYCLTALWPTIDAAEEMLSYAATRFPATEIQMALAKLATFCSLYGPDNFKGALWIEFLNSDDYLTYIFGLLRSGNVSGAQHLWLRHEGEFVQQFDEDTLQCLLGSIPLTVPSKELCLWFKAVVVPFVWRVLPKGQKILARWLEQRARNLELTEKNDWPHNGLKLAELGLPSSMSMPLEEDSGMEEMELLESLVVNLRHLCDLYVKYNCKLTLSEFEMSNTRSMAFLMLDKVLAPELISSVVENSVRPYALEQNLDLNKTLLRYIKDLSDTCSSQTTTLFSEWEEKAVAILRCMTNTDLVMDAVLEIMFKAVVPWSETVEHLVQQHLEKEHPKQDLLKESYRCMETKKLLSHYGVRNLSHSTDIMMLVRHILKQNLPTSLDDALYLAKANQLNPSEIHFHFILQLLEKAKMDEIMSLLKRMAPVEAKVTIHRLSSWATIFLSDKEHISEEHKKKKMLVTKMAVEALSYLEIIQKTENSAMQMECQDDLQRFMTIALLQESFDVFLTPDELDDPKVCKLFEEQVCKAYENQKGMKRFLSSGQAEDAAKASHDTGTKSKSPVNSLSSATTFSEASLCRLARRLKLTEQVLWAGMAHRALENGKVEKALKILSGLYQQYPNSDTGTVLFWAAQRLCQNLGDDVPMILPERFNLPAVIHQLSCQAAAVCSSDLLLDCMEQSKNTQRAAELYCQCQIDDSYGFEAKNCKPDGEQEDRLELGLKDFSEDGIVLDPITVLPLQYKIITCLMPLFSDSKMYPLENVSLAYCTVSEDEDFLGPLLSPLASMLQSLQECSQLELGLGLLLETYMVILHHVASYTSTAVFNDKQHHDEKWLVKVKERMAVVRQKAFSALNGIVGSLLQKVLNWKLVDFELAIGLCTILPKAEVLAILWRIITNAWQNYDKITDVAKVGAHICSIYEDEERHKFLSVITDAEWGSKLGKLGVSIQSVFRQCPETKRNLIPVLVKNPNITPEIILQYCSTYGLYGEQAINLLITTLLLQEDEEVGAGEAGPGEAGANGPPVDPLERALQVIPQLTSTRDLFVSLNAVIPKLSPYNYEKIERILATLEAANESTTLFSLSQMTGLLHHLKSYRRISTPSDLESTYLFENSFELTSLANTRLPFHMLLQTNHFFWKIISPELSEETFPTLLLICKLMKVSVDKLYMLVVNHVFEKRLKPMIVERAKRGQCHTQDDETDVVVKAIRDYTLCIQNLELAAATVHKIAQELPAGTEKTAFLKSSLELGHSLLKSQSFEEEVRLRGEAVISKMQQQYQRSAIENMVMSSQLSSPELLKLTGQPGRLLVALFEHSSVEERMKNPAGQIYPDIHAIVKEIAAISGVDVLQVRNFLLEKWLCKTDSSTPKDHNHQDYVTDIQSDPDMMRVVYLLRMHPMDMSARLLCPVLTAESWPLGGSGSRLTFEHRSRALYCLSHIADGATLESLLQIPKTKVKQYTQCYVYLSQLEKLNIPYTLELFLNSPKEGMIKGLWKNHCHEPKAVCLVAELSLEYQIYDPQLWNGILQKLVVFNMTRYLQKLLEAIGAIPCLWEVSSLLRTWRSVVLTPFMTASVPLNPEQQATFYKTFLLILKCPFLLNLDLIGVAKRFAQFSMPAYSLGTLLLIPCAKKREQQIQCFMLSCDPVLILDQVKTHMCTGELAGIPSLVVGTVFTHLCQKQQFDKLVKTEHFHDFKQHLIIKSHPNQVKDLVDYLVNHNRKQDAISLARGYLKSMEHTVGKQVSPPDPVKVYMERTLDSLGGQRDM
ncbi:kinetochore-associated protein 1 isoform X1 [Clupea harengus]|uniref:Kinetochore-associated protein 1 isoform X1 n=1 Tax=Clupea harengus TaxID=7950 RepID=A0A6P8F237_CLUHA|nr:kinetochore-associated protein 1 isoform X1 [Clupea harengus]XP_031422614.1 kinetochore-associated protein 1 isoform X1 [Clupea harengus]